jgi:ribosomal protein S18 acetylase RimI-like enzyme
MSNLPPLSIHLSSAPRELSGALRLVTDSIAQQRQTLSRSILSSPLFLAPSLALVFAVSYLNRREPAMAAILGSGVCIALLSTIRMVGAGYIEEAERIGREGMEVLKDEATTTVVATWGEKVIGVAVVRDGELWAWTVQLKYRRMGLGRDLLARAVEEVGKDGLSRGVADENASE